MVKVVALVSLDSFLAHEVKWKTEPKTGLGGGFSSFHSLCSSVPHKGDLVRTLFSVSLSPSLGFPLSMYCYILAKSEAS